MGRWPVIRLEEPRVRGRPSRGWTDGMMVMARYRLSINADTAYDSPASVLFFRVAQIPVHFLLDVHQQQYIDS